MLQSFPRLFFLKGNGTKNMGIRSQEEGREDCLKIDVKIKMLNNDLDRSSMKKIPRSNLFI